MARRTSRGFLENAGRTQLVRYLESSGVETYRNQTTGEMREQALEIFEHGQPDETSHMHAYGAE